MLSATSTPIPPASIFRPYPKAVIPSAPGTGPGIFAAVGRGGLAKGETVGLKQVKKGHAEKPPKKVSPKVSPSEFPL